MDQHGNDDNESVILSSSSKKERSIITEYVMKNIVPFYIIDVQDAVVLISALVKSELINLDDDGPFAAVSVEFDVTTTKENTNKIQKLSVSPNTDDDDNNDQNNEQENEESSIIQRNAWQLPFDIICRLEMLESLNLSFCDSISESSAIVYCSVQSTQQERHEDIKHTTCTNVKSLDLQYTYIQQSVDQNGNDHKDNTSVPGEANYVSVFDYFPNLLHLKMGCYNQDTIKYVIKDMKNESVSLKNIQTINFSCSEFTEEHLEDFLFNIMPTKMSQLRTLDLWSNHIQSVAKIAARCKKEQQQRIQQQPLNTNTLTYLDLHCNPVMKLSITDPKEREGLVIVLNTFKNISSLGASRTGQYHPDIEYLLRINQAGRGRLTKSIPLNVWPFILERAYNKSNEIYGSDFCYDKEKSPDGMYYLLRHGPLLQLMMHGVATDDNTP